MTIQLDLNKLLGFKIIASEAGRRPQQVILRAKVGDKNPGPGPITIGPKIGDKTGSKNAISSEIRIGAKIGAKPGFKIR